MAGREGREKQERGKAGRKGIGGCRKQGGGGGGGAEEEAGEKGYWVLWKIIMGGEVSAVRRAAKEGVGRAA